MYSFGVAPHFTARKDLAGSKPNQGFAWNNEISLLQYPHYKVLVSRGLSVILINTVKEKNWPKKTKQKRASELVWNFDCDVLCFQKDEDVGLFRCQQCRIDCHIEVLGFVELLPTPFYARVGEFSVGNVCLKPTPRVPCVNFTLLGPLFNVLLFIRHCFY